MFKNILLVTKSMTHFLINSNVRLLTYFPKHNIINSQCYNSVKNHPEQTIDAVIIIHRYAGKKH